MVAFVHDVEYYFNRVEWCSVELHLLVQNVHEMDACVCFVKEEVFTNNNQAIYQYSLQVRKLLLCLTYY